MESVEQEHEYGCRYCHKKFSNKQALGGHQNAHKVERAMEKNIQDTYEHHPRISYHRSLISVLPHFRLPNFGPRPLSNLQGLLPPGATNRPINLRNVPGNHHDESGLDLSLKLG